MENNEWKKVYMSLIAAVFFIILIVVASETMDGMSGGYALSFVSLFLTISSFAVALLFFTHARTMDTILLGKNLLAYWVYPADEARKSAEREFVEYREMNRALLYVVGGFLCLAMVLVVIFGGEGGVPTAGILLGVLVIIVIVAWGAPKLELKRALNASRDAYIAENGIIYEGAVYPFSSFLMRMDGVRFTKGTGKRPPILGFSFMQLVGLLILRPFEISIPVPKGEERKALEIITRLGGSAGKEEVDEQEPDNCQECGAPLNPGDEYCESCGAQATDSVPKNLEPSLHCPSCGESIKPGAKFCRSCGKMIE